MKIKNKGKVHPSPSSSSSASASFSSSSDGDFLDVLNYLPAAILALISVLAAEDREALAFMMRRSMETSSPPSSESEKKASKRSSKKSAAAARASSAGACVHSPPAFNYSCFDCYGRFWLRWDSSPHGDLIDQAIEAFDEQLASGENPRKNNAKGKKKEKIGRRPPVPPPLALLPPVTEDESPAPVLPSNDVAPATSGGVEEAVDETAALIIPSPPQTSNHKGLAGKVWPDVLGLFNSRLWSLWGPN